MPIGDPPAHTASTKSCPACGETIKASALKCRFCGEDIEAFVAKREAIVENTLFSGRPAALHSIGRWILTILTLGIAGLWYWLSSLSTRFEITTQRVRIERGVLSRIRQDIELYRIDDIALEQPMGMRMVGHAVLILRSTDRSSPDLRLYGIPGLVPPRRKASRVHGIGSTKLQTLKSLADKFAFLLWQTGMVKPLP